MDREQQRARAAARQRKWNAANRERSREISRISAQKRRMANVEEVRLLDRERMRRWRAANPERGTRSESKVACGKSHKGA